jgi:hypothetical protein
MNISDCITELFKIVALFTHLQSTVNSQQSTVNNQQSTIDSDHLKIRFLGVRSWVLEKKYHVIAYSPIPNT